MDCIGVSLRKKKKKIYYWEDEKIGPLKMILQGFQLARMKHLTFTRFFCIKERLLVSKKKKQNTITVKRKFGRRKMFELHIFNMKWKKNVMNFLPLKKPNYSMNDIPEKIWNDFFFIFDFLFLCWRWPFTHTTIAILLHMINVYLMAVPSFFSSKTLHNFLFWLLQ